MDAPCRYTQLYREGATATSFWVLLSGSLQHASFGSEASAILSCPESDVGVSLGTECFSGTTGMLRQQTVSCLGLGLGVRVRLRLGLADRLWRTVGVLY